MNIVCEKAWMVSAAQSCFYVGGVIGNLFFGYLADRCGRRPTLLWSTLLLVAVGLWSIYPSSYYVYIVQRFIAGWTFPSVYQIAFLLGKSRSQNNNA